MKTGAASVDVNPTMSVRTVRCVHQDSTNTQTVFVSKFESSYITWFQCVKALHLHFVHVKHEELLKIYCINAILVLIVCINVSL